MDIRIKRFEESDIDVVFDIQKKSFEPLYEKYRDDSTNPYMESKEAVFNKYTRDGTTGYVLIMDSIPVGAVRIIIDDNNKCGRVSALCVLPQFQCKGIAQNALLEIERIYPDVKKWSLDTILQEKGNCHLYEKIGYKRTGKTQQLSERMTLVFYEKAINNDIK